MAVRAKKRDFYYYQGDTFNHVRVTYKDEAGTVIDLTGLVASMKVKDANGVTIVSLDSAGLGGIDIDAPATGVIHINAAPSYMTTLVPGGTYFYDLQITDGAELVETLVYGSFIVDSQITD